MSYHFVNFQMKKQNLSEKNMDIKTIKDNASLNNEKTAQTPRLNSVNIYATNFLIKITFILLNFITFSSLIILSILMLFKKLL